MPRRYLHAQALFLFLWSYSAFSQDCALVFKTLVENGKSIAVSPYHHFYPPTIREFSKEKARQALQTYRTFLANPREGALQEPLSLEEKAGFVQAMQESAGGSLSIIDSFEKKHRYPLGDALSKWNFKQGITEAQVKSVVQQILKERLPADQWLTLAKLGWGSNTMHYLEHTYDEEFYFQELFKTLKKLNLLKNVTVWERAKRSGGTLVEAVDILTSIYALKPLLSLSGGFPIYLVEYRPLKSGEAREDISKIIAKYGTAESRKKFVEQFHGMAQRELAWNFFRKAYLAVVVGALVTRLYMDDKKDREEAQRAEAVLKKEGIDLASRLDMKSNNENENSLLERWKHGFFADAGRVPTDSETEFAKKLLALE